LKEFGDLLQQKTGENVVKGGLHLQTAFIDVEKDGLHLHTAFIDVEKGGLHLQTAFIDRIDAGYGDGLGVP